MTLNMINILSLIKWLSFGDFHIRLKGLVLDK